jgi:uncharacterized membrane protein YqhA
MDISDLLDVKHGLSNLILSIVAIIFLQLVLKIADFSMKNFYKKQSKRELDMRRAFKAIRLIAGDKWSEVREEIMRDEKMD